MKPIQAPSRTRTADGADLGALVDIELSSARHHAELDPEFYALPSRAAVEARLSSALARRTPDQEWLVAEMDGQVVGSASVEMRTPGSDTMVRPVRTAWVGVAVHEARRGRRIGAALMQSAEDWARERSAERMMLDASIANVGALRFYARLGYRRRGILMSKPVGAPAPQPPRDLGWREIAEIDARLERGEIDEAGWHAAMARLIVPAYLAAASPWEGSGKQGTAEDWERARSLVGHAVDGDGSFLDVGCANGYLLECLPRWTPHALDRYGLDIAPELVDLARRQLPDLDDRLFVGNALHWEPPHRFTYARTGLEYVPRHRRRELVQRLLGWCERLIIGVFSEEADLRATEELLRSWGHRIAGRSERAHHRKPGIEYRVLWIDAP